MKWTATVDTPRLLYAEIKRELLRSITPDVPDQYGFYLYVWENEKDIADDLQDTLEIAMDQAFEDFGIPLDEWKKVEE